MSKAGSAGSRRTRRRRPSRGPSAASSNASSVTSRSRCPNSARPRRPRPGSPRVAWPTCSRSPSTSASSRGSRCPAGAVHRASRRAGDGDTECHMACFRTARAVRAVGSRVRVSTLSAGFEPQARAPPIPPSGCAASWAARPTLVGACGLPGVRACMALKRCGLHPGSPSAPARGRVDLERDRPVGYRRGRAQTATPCRRLEFQPCSPLVHVDRGDSVESSSSTGDDRFTGHRVFGVPATVLGDVA